MVKLDPADARMPVLQWYPIRRGQEDGGELLAAFELFLVGVKCIFVTLRSTEGTNYITDLQNAICFHLILSLKVI